TAAPACSGGSSGPGADEARQVRLQVCPAVEQDEVREAPRAPPQDADGQWAAAARSLRSTGRSSEAGTAVPAAPAGGVLRPARWPRASNSGPPQNGAGRERSVRRRRVPSSAESTCVSRTPSTSRESPST